MSGGSGIDPYYQKDPPRRQTRKKSGSQIPETSPSSPWKATLNVEDARRLYFDEGLNLARVAAKLRVLGGATWRAFQSNGWVTRGNNSIDQEIHRLYFQERLSKSEIARILGVSWGKVDRVFQRNQWKSISPPTFADSEEARRFHDQGLTRKEIAKKLGVSCSTVNTYLNQLGVKGRTKFRTNEERLQRGRESARRGRERVSAGLPCEHRGGVIGEGTEHIS